MCLIMTEDGWQQLGRGKVCSNHNKLEGVYRPSSPEQLKRELDAHANAFCKVLEAGSIMEIKNFRHPLYGAFGERL